MQLLHLKVISIDPNYVDAHNNMGVALKTKASLMKQ